MSVFHYPGLHVSPYYQNIHDGRVLPECDRYSDRLLRLPVYNELNPDNAFFDAILTELSWSESGHDSLNHLKKISV